MYIYTSVILLQQLRTEIRVFSRCYIRSTKEFLFIIIDIHILEIEFIPYIVLQALSLLLLLCIAIAIAIAVTN